MEKLRFTFVYPNPTSQEPGGETKDLGTGVPVSLKSPGNFPGP